MKLLEYENNNDARVIKNTPLTCRCTHIGFETAHIDEYNALRVYNKHIVFNDRYNFKDMSVLPETMKIS